MDANEIEDVDREVRTELQAGVMRITLDRPESKNALTFAMRDRLIEQFIAVDADPAVRVVVLRGEGGAFCTGADLRGPRPTPRPKPQGAPERVVGDAARMITDGWQRLIASILDCSKPVIAAVNGTAAGGGAHLALACDLVLMSESARLIEVFVRRGIVPDAGGAYLLPRIVGIQRAKELMFLGDTVDGKRAGELGLCNAVFSDADFADGVEEWTARLASAPTTAIGFTKRMINASLDGDRAASLALEANYQELTNRTADAREGMLSFAERRRPEFTGW